MNLANRIFYFFIFIYSFAALSIIGSGCAQIGSPTGGIKDTIPPHLLKANPDFKTTNFTGNKITFTFDEYVETKDVQKNVLISPYPKSSPVVDYKLKTVTIKLKDTLMPNTTYAINFGDAIKDVNEGNPLKNFTYIFSTGDKIDSMEISGNVKLAKTGNVDSNIVVLLYRNANDSSVEQRKPDYLAKVDRKGDFIFTNLPEDTFEIYALLDGNGSKTYDSPIEPFAFGGSQSSSLSPKAIQLYAYAQEEKIDKPTTKAPEKKEKKFNYSADVKTSSQDLTLPLTIHFTKPIKTFNASKIILTDTLFRPVKSATATLDSTRQIVSIQSKWLQDADYRLIIDSTATIDSTDKYLPLTDTISFKTKRESEYGSILIRFKNIPAGQHLVLQFIKGTEVFKSVPITSGQYSEKIFAPGEYDLRILYDDNNNGKWDPGNYKQKLQPEKVTALDKKLSIRANWDNEREIQL